MAYDIVISHKIDAKKFSKIGNSIHTVYRCRANQPLSANRPTLLPRSLKAFAVHLIPGFAFSYGAHVFTFLAYSATLLAL